MITIMIILFMVYMIVWPILFVASMDCIYQVIQEIRNELRKKNGEAGEDKGNGTQASKEGR